MARYDDRLTLRLRPLTDTDFANMGGSITVTRAGMGAVTYSFQVGDFLCTKWVGQVRDMWVEPNSTVASSGWFPVSPPDDHGYVQYGGHRISEVTDLDNGFFQCSAGCMVDYATFFASHVLSDREPARDMTARFTLASENVPRDIGSRFRLGMTQQKISDAQARFLLTSAVPLLDYETDGYVYSSNFVSWSHTMTSLPNTILFVEACNTGTGLCPSRVTFAGIDLARLSQANAGTTNVSLWYLVQPPSGLHTIRVNFPTWIDGVGGSLSYSGIDPTNPFHGSVQATSGTTGSSASLAVPSTPDALILELIGTYPDASSATSGQTILWSNSISDISGSAATSPASAPLTTVSRSFLGGTAYGYIAVALT